MGRIEAAENIDANIRSLSGKLYKCRTGLNPKEPYCLIVKWLEELDFLEQKQVFPVVEYDGTPFPKPEARELTLIESIRSLALACPRLGKHRSHRNPRKS